MDKKIVQIKYTNYRGETGYRKIIPKELKFYENEYHPGEQWILEAYDIDKQADRSFSMKDIQEWKSQ